MFVRRVAIDLGTANVLIMENGKIVLNEAAVVAFDNKGGVWAVGDAAKEMLGRAPSSIKVFRPLRDGVIADFDQTEKMLQSFLRKITRRRLFFTRLKVLVCVPCGATQVERRAIRESILGAGANEVFLIDEPMAAAIGAGMPVSEAKGSMVVDIGGGTTEVAIISLRGAVHAQSVRIGGDRFDEAIVNYVRRNYGCLIGESTAERIKHCLGNAFPGSEVNQMEVSGRNIAEGIPRNFTLNSNDVLEALQEPLSGIIAAIREVLEKSPPELASDIASIGIMLTGGGALLRDLDRLIMEETGLPVSVADDPLTCVARGGGAALDMMARENIGCVTADE